MSSALKNLATLKRQITKRLKQALQDLQENLQHDNRVPVPVPVPVLRSPRGFRGGYYSRYANYSTIAGTSFAKNPRMFTGTRFYASSRFYTSYTGFRFNGFTNMRWRGINTSVLFHNFSLKTQFRLRPFAHVRAPSITQLIKKKLPEEETRAISHLQPVFLASPMARVPATLRLNILLTKPFHDVIMLLARSETENPEGCYLDFKIQPRILIPAATMMTAEVLGELLANLKQFEKHIVDLRTDLTRLSELGELPVRLLGEINTIRVYFPNCDRVKLEALLVEKHIVGGDIHEDYSNECAVHEDVVSISESDILSSYLLSLVSSASDYDEVLSSSSEAPVVRLQSPGEVVEALEVRIREDDEFCWV